MFKLIRDGPGLFIIVSNQKGPNADILCNLMPTGGKSPPLSWMNSLATGNEIRDNGLCGQVFLGSC